MVTPVVETVIVEQIPGPPGPLAATCATIADLEALAPPTAYPDGSLFYVQAGQQTWQLQQASLLTPDNLTVAAATVAAGGGNYVIQSPVLVPEVNTSFSVSGAKATYATSGLTAAKVATLPVGLPVGIPISFVDADGSITGGNTLSITPAAGTINGGASLVLNTARAKATVMQTAANVWVQVAS